MYRRTVLGCTLAKLYIYTYIQCSDTKSTSRPNEQHPRPVRPSKTPPFVNAPTYLPLLLPKDVFQLFPQSSPSFVCFSLADVSIISCSSQQMLPQCLRLCLCFSRGFFRMLWRSCCIVLLTILFILHLRFIFP